jgi:hypothetical protein
LAAFVVFYGITLALIAVSSYQNFTAANRAVSQETAALGTLYRAVSNYPEPIQGELQTMLHDYTRYVIEEAWPAQRRGVIPEGGTARVTVFQDKLLSFQPQTRAEEILHAETLREFGVASGSRHALSGGHDVHHRADDQREHPRDTLSSGRLDRGDRRQQALRPIRAHHGSDVYRMRDPHALAPAHAQDRMFAYEQSQKLTG